MTMELLKFEAEWCNPCSTQSEMLEDYDKTPIKEIDVDDNLEKANKYAVRSLPTMVLVENGDVLERWVGLTKLEEIEPIVESHVS